MPSGFNQHRSDIETVVGVQFSIMSPDEIEKRSVVEVVTSATFEGNEPKIGGLFDPRMGVLDNGKICRSCGQTNHGCPGHFGHFRLTRPVYFIQFLPTIMNVLKCVCIRCAKLKIDKGLRATLALRKEEARWNEVLKACATIGRCGQETEDGCGALQPYKYEKKQIASISAIRRQVPPRSKFWRWNRFIGSFAASQMRMWTSWDSVGSGAGRTG